ncbi:efflux RND transporter permease subunit [Shimia marina]|uniref:Toluene efflux pump membrane transporter TtgE n=1 Tax=Shimia marina TaxID=321267 RepID=A0A0P1ETA9_9RHOB|nr:efflux RND transporter permease subunit [Shimia marina]CUH53795.1 Toluene efflux pump membrane transporter TtgE [Shimia marina]SFE77291.1 multidrug efflux pump [Shimia marina]
MTGAITWAAERARMILAFIAISLVVGAFSYAGLPKEGEPDIDIPILYVSVSFPGISAEDAESLLVKPMETEAVDLDGLDKMTGIASENHASLLLEFDFGWDKSATIADVRDAMNSAQADFPEGADQYTITEINFSEFPIVIVNLTGDVPERTMARLAKDLQDEFEAIDAVLEAAIAGNRDEMVEVVIDPLRLESYNVTAPEIIGVVQNNNQLIAAGEVDSDQGTFSVKIPSSFDEVSDIYALPVKTNGDRIVTLGDLADINFTFEDRTGTARFDGENTVALQVVKGKGYNIIDTVKEIKATLANAQESWPEELKAAVQVGTSNDQSRVVGSMVRQLEGSVLTAIALVMIVILASLGSRAAMLVGFAIPASFLLCFAFLALMGVTISNMVMFGLILAVGMLVDGAIVVVEYADKRIKEGTGPMHAYVEAAQRMFWPIVSSTATTLCAFLPMLFWPGIPGEFMGMLPVTMIFVLSASLLVALIYLPVVGGISGRMSRFFGRASEVLRARLPWVVRALLVPPALFGMFSGVMQMLHPTYLLPDGFGMNIWLLGDKIGEDIPLLVGAMIFILSAFTASIMLSAAEIRFPRKSVESGFRLNGFGLVIRLIVGNPIMPIVAFVSVIGVVLWVSFYYGQNNNGVEFFVDTEPEQATALVRARGNLSLAEKDAMVRAAENIIMDHPAVINVFSFAGEGGLSTGGPSNSESPQDTIGQVQFEIIPWEDRPTVREKWFFDLLEREVSAPDFAGNTVLDELNAELAKLPGFFVETKALEQGPGSGKPIHLRLRGDGWDALNAATAQAREAFENTPGLTLVEDTLPLPGIDWQIDVDVEKAGRYGADVATVGAMVQLVTRGILLDTMRVDSSDEEIEIRLRLPDQDRVLSTLDTLKVRTADGLVPLSNFVTRSPVPKRASIARIDQERYYDVKADIEPGLIKLVSGQDDDVVTHAFVKSIGPDVSATGDIITAANGDRFHIHTLVEATNVADVQSALDDGARRVPVTPTERIETLTNWLNTTTFDRSVSWEWTGDQEEQAESAAFLTNAFSAALGLMFVILLAQFNSFYNSVLVLLAVILSTAGVLVGMLVMDQTFSIIMTGTGIVALAGIVVNNNIVLIDTYQEYSQYMPRIDAIVRTAQSRIRPVLLTTITTMAGLTPMMFGLSLDFIEGGYSINSPTSLWWKQLATAVVFGLGIATVLTLVFTPSMLALRVWATTYFGWLMQLLARLSMGRASRAGQDWALRRAARDVKHPVLMWNEDLPDALIADAPAPTKSDMSTPVDPEALAPEVEAPRGDGKKPANDSPTSGGIKAAE